MMVEQEEEEIYMNLHTHMAGELIWTNGKKGIDINSQGGAVMWCPAPQGVALFFITLYLTVMKIVYFLLKCFFLRVSFY